MNANKPIYVLGERVLLQQPVEGFRTSIDSVLLASACRIRENQTVLDMGCGVGSAGLCVLRRVEGTLLSGVDIQHDHLELARQNAILNAMSERCHFVCSDIRTYRDHQYDHVICNPPFLDAGAHIPSPSQSKALAMGHKEVGLTVKDWIDSGFYNLKPLGSLTLIHRAGDTDKIIHALGKRFGSIEIIPLWPKVGVAAKRVIIRAIKNRKSPTIIHPGLVLHKEDGKYSDIAENIFRNMAPLL